MNANLVQYISDRISEFNLIEDERKELLASFSSFIKEELTQPFVNLNYICTHNSRRSHLGQIWGAVAAAHYGFHNIHTYSGGTEATALFPSVASALKNSGINVSIVSDMHEVIQGNPVYAFKYSSELPPIICFSKKYDDSFNPSTFIAIMTCDHADQNCPYIPEAKRRFPIKYQDPKVADGTPEQSAKYEERCAQIAREMLYAFSLI